MILLTSFGVWVFFFPLGYLFHLLHHSPNSPEGRDGRKPALAESKPTRSPFVQVKSQAGLLLAFWNTPESWSKPNSCFSARFSSLLKPVRRFSNIGDQAQERRAVSRPKI